MRRTTLKKAQQGFTLVELMIVVAIIGILAVLAVFGVRKYIANAKTAEARNSLGQLEDAAAAYDREKAATSAPLAEGNTVAHEHAPGTGTPVPATVPAGCRSTSRSRRTGTAATPSPVEVSKFTLDAPQYYQYHYERGTTAATPDPACPPVAGFAASAKGSERRRRPGRVRDARRGENGRVKLSPALAEEPRNDRRPRLTCRAVPSEGAACAIL